MSKILIGIIVVMGLGSYILWNQNAELNKLNLAYEVKFEEQERTIQAIQQNLESTAKNLKNLQVQNQQYEAEMTEYLDIFRRHNIAKLASAKPGMIETRANAQTKEVFDAIEADSNRISSLND
jgi:septal ring factor EnvC (AmiA/AmiB activator)